MCNHLSLLVLFRVGRDKAFDVALASAATVWTAALMIVWLDHALPPLGLLHHTPPLPTGSLNVWVICRRVGSVVVVRCVPGLHKNRWGGINEDRKDGHE